MNKFLNLLNEGLSTSNVTELISNIEKCNDLLNEMSVILENLL